MSHARLCASIHHHSHRSPSEQFGEAVALYFHFLSFYTKHLVFISAVGVLFYFISLPYSTLYSSILLLWSVTFVEWWRIKQRILSVRWGTKGSFRVEKRRAQYTPLSWWKKDLRMLASLPVILLFASVLAVILTAIFIFEAFVTQLYTGPGHRFIVRRRSFLPIHVLTVTLRRASAPPSSSLRLCQDYLRSTTHTRSA